MMAFARSCVGKPFSTTAMARSLVWPRTTDGSSYFCAEIVADVLKHGGLLDRCSNPGAATPEALHQLYKARAATTANPYLLRQANCQRRLTTESVVTQRVYQPPQLHSATPPAASATAATTAATAAAMFHAQPLCPMRGGLGPFTAAYSACGAHAATPAAAMQTHAFPPATASRDAPLCGTVGAKSALRVLHAGDASMLLPAKQPPLGITLNSLDFRRH